MRIAAGKQDKLDLGNIDLQRDWGWVTKHKIADLVRLTILSRGEANANDLPLNHSVADSRELFSRS